MRNFRPPFWKIHITPYMYVIRHTLLQLKSNDYASLPNWPLTTGLKNKSKATFEIEQCWIFAVLWWPFWKWRPVEICRCQESIRDIIIYLHMKCWICAVLWRSFWKWRPVEIFRCQESIRDIIIYPHMICRWNRTMLNLCGIVVAILKMETGRNCLMSGINSGHHYPPTYQILMRED